MNNNNKNNQKVNSNQGRGDRRREYKRPESDFEEKVIQVKRVSKKTKGGNTIGFSVLTVVGDRKGNVGIGLGKGPDVASSIRKAMAYAKKHQIKVPMRGTTIPHRLVHKYGAAKVLLKPAPVGAGVIAGGAVRSVLSVAGIKDVVGKMMGSRNAVTNVYCVFEALQKFKLLEKSEKKKVKEIKGS